MNDETSTEAAAAESTGIPGTEAAQTDAPPKTTFADLGLGAEVQRAVADLGWNEPMEVQTTAVPLIRTGRDLIVQSRTGSGKTAAFAIPFIDWIVKPGDAFVQAIVLMPTRELALQVASETVRIGAQSKISVVPIYGGAPMGRQIEQLRAGGQIVSGTPGRVLDHIRRGTLRLDRVRCVVLDECDEMLSMGFQEDIEAILDHTPPERQTLLFSATVPEGVQRLARRFMRNPEFVQLSADFVGVHAIRHVYYQVTGAQREGDLVRVIEFENPERGIVFCNTREETGRVAEYLRRQGLDAEAISSDLSQSDRERVMTRMRAGGIRFLVATDVAARGIDLENLPCVINYALPESPEIYIHRTGRTGRAGKGGTAVSLVGPQDVGTFYYIKLLYKIRPEERSLPSEIEIRSKREGAEVLRLRALLPANPGAEWYRLAHRIMGAPDGERMVAALAARVLEGGAVAAAALPAQPRTESGARPSELPPRTSERTGGRGPSGSRRPPPDRGRPGDRRGPRTSRGGMGGSPPPRPASEQPETKEFWETWAEGARGTSADGDGTAGATDPGGTPGDVDASGARGPTEPAAWRDSPPRHDDARPREGARPPREGARPRGEPRSRGPGPGETRLYLNLGRKDGVAAQDVADIIAAENLSVPLANIDVMNTHTYINAASADAERLGAALSARDHNGRRLLCEPARPPKRGF